MAGNSADIKRLLQTKQCQGGDLSEANLAQFNLSGAYLEGAKLMFAFLARRSSQWR